MHPNAAKAAAFYRRSAMKRLPKAGLVLLAIAFALSADAQALRGTLGKIKESGQITIGYRESSIPFSYLDANGKPIGYSMDLCARIVDAIRTELKMPNLKVAYNPVTSGTRVPMMLGGMIDLECGSTSNLVAREKQVAFGYTTFVTGIRMLVKADSGITSISQLDNKPVVTTIGTTSDALIKASEHGKHVDVKNLYGKDHADSFRMVESGRAVAFVMDDVLLAGLIANASNPKEFAIVGEPFRVEPYAIMLRKDDPQFKALVDETLAGLMKSGDIVKIYDKWFMGPIPPKGINMNLPMSKALKDAIAHPNDKGAS
jgi:glutamate/aspartate transport system substrate-binding protein